VEREERPGIASQFSALVVDFTVRSFVLDAICSSGLALVAGETDSARCSPGFAA
jgi:hypothetical protein